jgi:glutathione S-transferase
MKLHIANKNYSSWSLRPWVLMRTLGLDFEEVLHPFAMGGGPSRFDVFSPSGKVPCLIDGDQTIWDSLAISEYLSERCTTVWPQSAVARAWARCATAEMHAGFATLREVCSMSCGVRVQLRPESLALLAPDLARLQSLWRDGLQRFGGPFLAGDSFTAADAFFCPVAFRVQTYGLVLDPICSAYVQTLLDLPAMRQWYEEALREPWIEPSHEADVLAFGQLISDARHKAG